MHHKDTLAKPKLILRNKISLIIFGIFFCIILLEIGLRLGGFIFISLQEQRNIISIRQKGTCRIMCLGESTTAGPDTNSYPAKLEEILNRHNIGIKFSVINKGGVGIDSAYILTQLEENLNKYRPDMVITMMGINDRNIKYYEGILDANSVLFNKFRTYRLLRILCKHAADKIKEKASFNKDEHVYIKLGWSYYQQREFTKAEGSFKKAIYLNPGDEYTYIELGRFYNRQEKFVLAEELFKKAIELNHKSYMAYSNLGWCYIKQTKLDLAEEPFKKAVELDPGNEDAYMEMGWLYSHQNRFIEAENMFRKAVELNPRNALTYIELGACYSYQGKLNQAEEMFKKSIELKPDNERAYGSLIVLYTEIGDAKAMQEYTEKANRLRLEYSNPLTFRNYQRLKAVLDKRGIKLACVQYPMRNIEPLKRIFQGQEGVIFVDNEKVFKEAVSKDGYKEYFVDMFGGDFGHCTRKGNKLLAENIANVVLKEVFGK